MKYIVYIFLLFPILVTAQTYKYIGTLIPQHYYKIFFLST